MHFTALPESAGIVSSDNFNVVAQAIGKVFPGRRFKYYSIVSGAPYSIRILSEFSYDDFVELPRPLSSEDVAHQLVWLINEARYNPPENPGKNRGWEVRVAMLKGYFVAIVIAKWI